MKHLTIVGNWKMHQSPEQAVRLVDHLQKKVKPHTHVTNVLCPPAVDLVSVNKKLQLDTFKLGAQNLHEQDEGAFTGEISGPMLKGLAEYVIIGHSERRRYQHESDKQIALKVAAAVRNKLKPILCVGETLGDKQAGYSKRVVADQLHGCLSQISAEDLRNLKVTYEPVWAISTNANAKADTPDDVEPMVQTIRTTLAELFGEAASSQVEILYGGSVNPGNARAFLKLKDVNGLLIGGASLNYEQFADIIETAAAIADGR
jgi:triosephosphate isomerase (TIM)